MKTVRTLLLLAGCLLVGQLFAEQALACRRCGHYGYSCRYVQHVQPTYVYPPASTIIINQLSPVPVQGQTVYGYAAGQQAQIAPVDPNEALRQLGRLAEKGLDGYSELAAEVTSSQAAVQALQAAAQLVETKRVQVRQGTSDGAAGSLTGAPAGLLSTRCASCHSGAMPAGGLTLTADAKLSGTILARVVQAVDSGKMPKDGPPLTQVEKAFVMAEAARLLEE